MKPGRAETMTHDYKRHGTVDLFAAMNIATGGCFNGPTTDRRGRTARYSTTGDLDNAVMDWCGIQAPKTDNW
jgi:hypothetical protein